MLLKDDINMMSLDKPLDKPPTNHGAASDEVVTLCALGIPHIYSAGLTQAHSFGTVLSSKNLAKVDQVKQYGVS